MLQILKTKSRTWVYALGAGAGAAIVVGALALYCSNWFEPAPFAPKPGLQYHPRKQVDTSGYSLVIQKVQAWGPEASLQKVSDCWDRAGFRVLAQIDRDLDKGGMSADEKTAALIAKATVSNYEGEPTRALAVLEKLRANIENNDTLAEKWLSTIIYCQGVTALRRGEDENCILCRGESSCILPIAPAAVHTNPAGSRQAIKHFSEYLALFPDDLEVRWLLNLAYMTLGEHPAKVDPKFLISLDGFYKSEFDIGKFRDVGHLAGVNRLNQAGGAIMEDFDNDGLLDLVITCFDPTEPMAFFRNKGNGKFEDRTVPAGLKGQVGGGLQCMQTDYNNDGHMDIFIPRGAWLSYPVRPSLLRNNGNGTFTDVTKEAGLAAPVNSGAAAWADFDNDGFLDVFICCEKQPSRLYRNKGDGTFEDVTAKAGLPTETLFCKGCAWIDFDNDGYPDLFINYFQESPTKAPQPAQLFRNNGNGTFTNVTKEMGIDGPRVGFSCWAFDYDNDGFLDIFATSYDRSVTDVIGGLLGKPHTRDYSRLYRNLGGKGFKDVSKEVGLDMVMATMGSNFGDFDNDGFLDIYLGTGDPNLATLVPNRMFKNVVGKRFADITASSGTGHLQKGHGVACGDLRRTGNVDIFIEMGGAINGDKYHNILFQNPGHDNKWLTVKLVGVKTNRAAIGAHIKVVTAAETPLTVHRHVSSGSSFGGNPLEQTIGLARADRVALLEITWPTSRTTQVFRDISVNQAIEVTEFATDYRKLNWKAIPPLQ
jgi:hypothetical protein